MTPTFWELYLPALAMLLGLGILAGVVEARVRSAFRRWRVQREVNAMINAREALFDRRRVELDGLATARDKAERKIL